MLHVHRVLHVHILLTCLPVGSGKRWESGERRKRGSCVLQEGGGGVW